MYIESQLKSCRLGHVMYLSYLKVITCKVASLSSYARAKLPRLNYLKILPLRSQNSIPILLFYQLVLTIQAEHTFQSVRLPICLLRHSQILSKVLSLCDCFFDTPIAGRIDIPESNCPVEPTTPLFQSCFVSRLVRCFLRKNLPSIAIRHFERVLDLQYWPSSRYSAPSSILPWITSLILGAMQAPSHVEIMLYQVAWPQCLRFPSCVSQHCLGPFSRTCSPCSEPPSRG